MVTDPRNVFRKIYVNGADGNAEHIPVGDRTVRCKKQTFRSKDAEKVDEMERHFAESVILGALDSGGGNITGGTTVELSERRVIVDPQRLGYAAVWTPLQVTGFGEDRRVIKEVGYVITDTEALR